MHKVGDKKAVYDMKKLAMDLVAKNKEYNVAIITVSSTVLDRFFLSSIIKD